MKKLFFGLIALLTSVFSLTSCCNSSEKIQRINDTFVSFPYSDRFIMVTLYEIRVGDTVIDRSDIKYNGEYCHILFTEEPGAYGYSVDPSKKNVINIIYVEYESLAVELIENLELPDSVIEATACDGKLYFRTNDPSAEEYNQVYTAYDIEARETQTLDIDDIQDGPEYSGDHGRSSLYTVRNSGKLTNTLVITNKETEKTKEVGNKLLKTCEEGRKLIKLGITNLGTGCSEAYEKDGSIYIPFLYCLQPLGNPCYYYIMKYDFESHTMEYYTSVYFEEYPEEIVDIYIP